MVSPFRSAGRNIPDQAVWADLLRGNYWDMVIFVIFLTWIVLSLALSPLLGGALHEMKRWRRPILGPPAPTAFSRQIAARRAQFGPTRGAGRWTV